MTFHPVLVLFNHPSQKEFRQELRRYASRPEIILWQYLRKRRFCGYKFRRQQGIGRYVVDFYCPERRLAIEVDGDSHCSPQERRRDAIRDAWISHFGIRIVRFSNDQVRHDLDGVLFRLAVELWLQW